MLAPLLLSLFVTADAPPIAVVPRDYLVLPSVSRGGRNPIRTDALEALRLDGNAPATKAGDKVKLADGREVAWVEAKAKEDGTLERPEFRGGYARTIVTSDSEKVASSAAIAKSQARSCMNAPPTQ